MLSPTGTAFNGTNGCGTHLPCASDYEPAPILDTTLTAPTPKWRDDFPLFTHNISWLDSDGISHSLTLRSDDLQALFADLRLLKSMIRASRQKAPVDNPGKPQQNTEHERVVCKIHNVEMERRVSKRSGGHYFSHRLVGNDLCFGKEK